MDTNAILVLAGLGLATLMFLVFLVFSFKTWKFFHVFMALLVFATTIPTIMYMSFVARTRIAWMERYDYYSEELKKKELQEQELAIGVYKMTQGSDPQLIEPKDTLRLLKTELERWVIDRGRVWRDCVPTSATATSVTLNTNATPPPAPADPTIPPDGSGDPAASAPPPDNQIEQDAILYAFWEKKDTADGYKAPYYYLGEFRVTAVTTTSVTLTPALQLDPEQSRAVSQTPPAGTTWVLYDIMPRDGHTLFVQEELEEEGTDINQYIPNEAALATVLPKAIFPTEFTDQQWRDAITEIHQQLLIDYKYNDLAVSDIQADFPTFDPHPDHVWHKVQMLKDKSITVDAPGDVVDLTEIDITKVPYNDYNREVFDTSGQALRTDLKQGEPTELLVSRELVLLHSGDPDLDRFIDDEAAKIAETIYRRKLVDYQYGFHEMLRRRLELQQSLTAIQRATEEVKYSHAQIRGSDPDTVGGQVAIKDAEIAKLNTDLVGFNRGLDVLTQRAAELSAQETEIRRRLSNAYAISLQMEKELEQAQRRLAALILTRVNNAVPTEEPAGD